MPSQPLQLQQGNPAMEQPVNTVSTPWWIVNTHYKRLQSLIQNHRVQELCKSQGGRPGLSILMSLTVSVDVKQH